METPKTYTPEELDQKTQLLVLKGERKSKCYESSTNQKCRAILLYETDTHRVYHLLVEERSEDGANFDVNKAIQDPESYSGPMETFDLAGLFSTTDEITTYRVSFADGNEMDVEVDIKDGNGDITEDSKKITLQQLYNSPPSE